MHFNSKNLPGCVLLMTLSLAVAALASSAGNDPAADAQSDPVEGPILLPFGAAYADQPIADEETPDEETPAEETPEEPHVEQAAPGEQQPPAETAPADDPTAADEVPDEQSEESAEETSGTPPGDAEPAETAPATEAEPEPVEELTPAMAAVRDRVRRTLAAFRRPLLSAAENTPTELMHYCLAFGCATEVYRAGTSGQRINALTCLCWNYPCAGYVPLAPAESHIAARIGYGLQEHPSQLLAVLALSRVKPTYPVRAGEDVRTVADLVEYEKLSCRSATDLSWKLIGLSYYAVDEPAWKNNLGQEWSIERIVREELGRPVIGARDGGTHRLMGLSHALARREKQNLPIAGQFERARKFIDEFHDYALQAQNSDGSWGPYYLARRGTSRDLATQLRSTGHVAEWLAMSLPEEDLADPRMVRAVEQLNRLLASNRYRRGVRSLTTREIGSVMHAVRALNVYDLRYFQPRTPKKVAAYRSRHAPRDEAPSRGA